MRSLKELPPVHVCAAELEKRRNGQCSPLPVQPMLDDRRDPTVAEATDATFELDLS
jgi:hypothetical protein